MIEYLIYSLSVFTGFFAIMNPIANIPIFLSIVQDSDETTRERITKKATIIAFLIAMGLVPRRSAAYICIFEGGYSTKVVS